MLAILILIVFFIIAANFDINIATGYATTTRPMPPLTAFTICMWIRIDESQASNEHSVFSYAVPGQDNEILIFFYKDGLYLEVNYISSG